MDKTNSILPEEKNSYATIQNISKKSLWNMFPSLVTIYRVMKALSSMHTDDKSSYIILNMFSVIFSRFYQQNIGILEKLPIISGHL